jgi:hypothetical protein
VNRNEELVDVGAIRGDGCNADFIEKTVQENSVVSDRHCFAEIPVFGNGVCNLLRVTPLFSVCPHCHPN